MSYHLAPTQMAVRVSPGQGCSRRNGEKQKELSLEYWGPCLSRNTNHEGAFSSHPENGLEWGSTELREETACFLGEGVRTPPSQNTQHICTCKEIWRWGFSRQRGPEIAPAPEFPTEVDERGFWGQKRLRVRMIWWQRRLDEPWARSVNAGSCGQQQGWRPANDGQWGQSPSSLMPAEEMRVTKIRSPLPTDSTSWNPREKGRQKPKWPEGILNSLRKCFHTMQRGKLRWKLKSVMENKNVHTSDFVACKVCTYRKGIPPQGTPPWPLSKRAKDGQPGELSGDLWRETLVGLWSLGKVTCFY